MENPGLVYLVAGQSLSSEIKEVLKYSVGFVADQTNTA